MTTAGTSRLRIGASIGLVLYVALLCVYSVVPGGTLGTGAVDLLPGRDLAAHGLAYGGLTLILCCALGKGGAGKLTGPVLAVASSAGLAAALELVQAFLPWRTFSVADLAAGIGGILFAAACWLVWSRLEGRARARSSVSL
ncbi:unnamed protein product [marine sediment metagenome]|uniref:VanZ-like domain-containing protein n=1 Tax=marine sediment metagenome TaxID=412755 RepID=X1V861_9ZZZZ